jgi:membrane associated rhomboid family serine protease
MFGTALRLIGANEAGLRLGEYLRNLTAKYLVLSAAGIVFLIAIVFALLAVFWALDLWTRNPVSAALIMAGSLFLAGFWIALTAYGLTRRRPSAAKHAIEPPRYRSLSSLPAADDFGRQIELAARHYGPVQVAAAAAAGGFIAGILLKRLTQPRIYASPRRRRGVR